MEPGLIYHVYNQANGRERLFVEEENYEFFLRRIAKYLLPVAGVCAYRLQPKRFDLLVHVKDAEILLKLNLKKWSEKNRIDILENDIVNRILSKRVNHAFSNLFNSYAKSFNKMYKRAGSLFMQNMRVIEIIGDKAFCDKVCEFHCSPAQKSNKQGNSWLPNSYKDLLNRGKTMLDRDFVMDKFGCLENFVKIHESRPWRS